MFEYLIELTSKWNLIGSEFSFRQPRHLFLITRCKLKGRVVHSVEISLRSIVTSEKHIAAQKEATMYGILI
jgi:hypothetical protein